MSRTFHHGERRIRVRSIRKQDPDGKKIGRALIAYARAEAERQAQAAARRARQPLVSKPNHDEANDRKGDAA